MIVSLFFNFCLLFFNKMSTEKLIYFKVGDDEIVFNISNVYVKSLKKITDEKFENDIEYKELYKII